MRRVTKKNEVKNDSSELLLALNMLEKEKHISKEALLEAIRQSLLQACKNHYGKTEASNVVVNINPDTCEYEIYAEKTVVETVEDDLAEISLTNAKLKDSRYELGDIVRVDIQSKEFGRIATQNAKNVILQKIREEERKVLYHEYFEKERDIVTGVVQRYNNRNVSINLGKVDAILASEEMIRGEMYYPTQRLKVYVLEVKDTPKGPKISVSRTHPEFVKRLFEEEVTEVHDGIVEIRSIAREAGSRSKIAVWSNNPDVDPVGACVGMNGSRVNAVVDELHGEKIDIISWNENPALLIENALSPAKVISVIADPDEKSAKVVVPDYQLSLAIGKEGQNARLAARLTGFKIDIKSETQARESGDLLEYEEDYYDDDEYYDEDGYYEDEYAEDGYGDGQGGYAEDGYADGQDGYAEDQGGYADGQGGYAEDQGAYADDQGGYADGQGGYAEDGYADDQGGYADGQGGYAEDGYADDQDGYADGQGGYAEDGYADDQGGYADDQGSYADGQDGYAEDQGGYADGQDAYAAESGGDSLTDAGNGEE